MTAQRVECDSIPVSPTKFRQISGPGRTPPALAPRLMSDFGSQLGADLGQVGPCTVRRASSTATAERGQSRALSRRQASQRSCKPERQPAPRLAVGRNPGAGPRQSSPRPPTWPRPPARPAARRAARVAREERQLALAPPGAGAPSSGSGSAEQTGYQYPRADVTRPRFPSPSWSQARLLSPDTRQRGSALEDLPGSTPGDLQGSARCVPQGVAPRRPAVSHWPILICHGCGVLGFFPRSSRWAKQPRTPGPPFPATGHYRFAGGH